MRQTVTLRVSLAERTRGGRGAVAGEKGRRVGGFAGLRVARVPRSSFRVDARRSLAMRRVRGGNASTRVRPFRPSFLNATFYLLKYSVRMSGSVTGWSSTQVNSTAHGFANMGLSQVFGSTPMK